MKKIKTLFAVLVVFTVVLSLTAYAGTTSNGTANKLENVVQNTSEENVTAAESEKAPVDNSTASEKTADTATSNTDSANGSTSAEDTSDHSDILLAYFSAAGTGTSQPSETGNSAETTAAAETSEQESGEAVSDAESAAETAVTTSSNDTPIVYFTSDISAESLVKIYEALNWTPDGNVAVKISTGEPPASNYLRPELIGDLIKKVDGTIVECNTAYGGSRSSSVMHKQVAEDHGFMEIADFDLMDEDGEVEWPMTGGTRLDKVIVGSHAENYTDWVILSHFKGHAMAGFGGAIKNVGIGISSPSGKVYVHTAGTKTSGSIWYNDQDAWLEALAEMVSGFSSHVGGAHIIYINVMNRLSVDCDCDGHPAEPDIHDIGILASTDPVALDQACVDLIYQAEGNTSLVKRMESLHAVHTLEHAEEIGLGSRTYELASIDD